ncbi:Y-family DNA polymerase [Phytohalomonas tamaricis]|uniref:Y-family DNA polymerase n=1 Tax=Phytohalomonas tamaricis TaxID=2081032 RepID=UPI000D0BB421|nr:Y-family DNA polymerase [Phytohalomonas tamaricis]
MRGPFALVDCNNFYVSCERVFRPHLEGVPVGVLSNNDGCIIARSNELKQLGVEMGTPAHMLDKRLWRYGLVLCSSNYELFGDMSARVLNVLREWSPDVEPYSVDESWLGFAGFDPAALPNHCQRMRQTVRQWTGIPVSVGVAPTRTLAKLANRYAKKNPATQGVHIFESAHSPDVRALLERTPVSDLWGVGGRITVRLKDLGIHTAWDLAQAEPKRIRKHFSVVLERTALELRGIPAIDMNDFNEPKKNIMTSRSFGRLTGDAGELREAVRQHAQRGAEKLRDQRSLARAVMVFVQTNQHRLDLAQYSNSVVVALSRPSSDSRDIIAAAQFGLERIYRKGYLFIKAGVMLLDLIDADQQQLGIFETPITEAKRARSEKLMAVMDQINKLQGRGTVRWGMTGDSAAWHLRSEHLSPRWTTRWEELPRVKLW